MTSTPELKFQDVHFSNSPQDRKLRLQVQSVLTLLFFNTMRANVNTSLSVDLQKAILDGRKERFPSFVL